MTSYATFDDWFYEVEGFGLRAERATDDLGPNAKRWLETAWQLGAEAERKECAKIAEAVAIRARSTPNASES